MKRLLTIVVTGVLLSTAFMSAKAQTTANPVTKVNYLSALKKTTDTVATGITKTLTLNVTGVYENFDTQVVLVKGTGTPGGVVRAFVSNNGTDWSRLGTDSLIITNVARQNKVFHFGPPDGLFYAIQIAATGTQLTYIPEVTSVLRKRQP